MPKGFGTASYQGYGKTTGKTFVNMKHFIWRHPIVTYFSIAFLISWGSGFIVFIPGVCMQNTK